MSRVVLEVGSKTTFAIALDWPGWCRRGRDADEALEALDNARARYVRVVGVEGPGERVRVIGSVTGSTTTDFGAPAMIGPWDERPLARRERERQVAVLEDCWDYFDRAFAHAPDVLTKGPRGGGRDRRAILEHTKEAERAYCAKLGQRVTIRTPWPDQRAALQQVLLHPVPSAAWPVSYALRRLAWHVLDHAWEMEDRGNGPTP
ncbi:MAG TPA: hypothetical protein PLG60_01520 [Acidimicrobiales bacterium]|nr:hypothetical protein [Acidimicrobiales bacterium]